MSMKISKTTKTYILKIVVHTKYTKNIALRNKEKNIY